MIFLRLMLDAYCNRMYILNSLKHSPPTTNVLQRVFAKHLRPNLRSVHLLGPFVLKVALVV